MAKNVIDIKLDLNTTGGEVKLDNLTRKLRKLGQTGSSSGKALSSSFSTAEKKAAGFGKATEKAISKLKSSAGVAGGAFKKMFGGAADASIAAAKRMAGTSATMNALGKTAANVGSSIKSTFRSMTTNVVGYAKSVASATKNLIQLGSAGAKAKAMLARMRLGISGEGAGGGAGGGGGGLGGLLGLLGIGGASAVAAKKLLPKTLPKEGTYSFGSKYDFGKTYGKVGGAQMPLAAFTKTTEAVKKQDSLLAMLKKRWLAVGATAAAVGLILKQSFDFAGASASAIQQEQAFRNMTASFGANADELISKLKEVSAGTIATADLIRNAGTAMMLGVPVEDLTKLMEIARATSKLTGQSVTDAFNDISLAVGRQSKMILDNLGIIVNVEKANKDYAKQLGKTADALTEAERKAAFMNATIKGGEELMARLGGQAKSSAEYFQSLGAIWKNLTVLLGKGLLVILQAIPEALAEISMLFNRLFQYMAKAVGKLAGDTKLGDWARAAEEQFKGAADEAQKFIDAIMNLDKAGKRPPIIPRSTGGGGDTEAEQKQADRLAAIRLELLNTWDRLTHRAYVAEIRATQDKYDKLVAEAKGNAKLIAMINKVAAKETAEILNSHNQEISDRFAEAHKRNTAVLKEEAAKRKAIMDQNKAIYTEYLTEQAIHQMSSLQKEYAALVENYEKRKLLYGESMEAFAQFEKDKAAIVQENTEKMIRQNGRFLESLSVGIQKSIGEIETWGATWLRVGAQINETIADNFTTSMWDYIEGTKTAGEAIADFGKENLKWLTSIIVKQLILNGLKKLWGMESTSSSSLAVAGNSAEMASVLALTASYYGLAAAKTAAGIASAAAGAGGAGAQGLTAVGTFVARAAGGPVSGGNSYLVGEKGPELFTPSRSGDIMSNRDMTTLANTGPVELSIVNVPSPELVASYLASPEGKDSVLNIIRNNNKVVRRMVRA